MRRNITGVLAGLSGLLLLVSLARADQILQVSLQGLTHSGRLPLSSAFCLPQGTQGKPQDKSPGISWSVGPTGTLSYVLLMIDPDVVADLSLMNKPGVTIPLNAPRMDIYHWILIDIPPSVQRIPPGAEGDGFVPGGKPIGATPYGVRGTNDYWPYFNKNPKMPATMNGPYGAYDGPCPPSNDLLEHSYKFQIYALNVKTLGLSGQFFAPEVLKAMVGHILAKGEVVAKFNFDEK